VPGTYAALLFLLVSSSVVGQAVFAICGRRTVSWLSPAVGLGLLCPLAWGTVQLSGHATSALIAVLAATGAGLAICRGRTEPGDVAATAVPVAALTVLAASIPFVAEHHFGILGTGLNPDMSQHLFAASWLADPQGPAPNLFGQGYPVGPHSLAVAASKLTGGNLVEAFDGLTMAIPLLAALASLSVLSRLSAVRRIAASVLVGVTYMVASYLAQGQFKELFEALFVLAFGLGLDEIATDVRATDAPRWRLFRAIPLAGLVLGALYAYSAPGLVWLGGAAALWAFVKISRSPNRAAATRPALGPVAVALLVTLVLAAPELGRIADFESSASRVATAARAPGIEAAAQAQEAHQRTQRVSQDPIRVGGKPHAPEHFNNSLGNLFNPISPLEGLGIWPTGDFRLDPGAGAAPAIAFYMGGVLALVAVALGIAGALRRGRLGLVSAFAAAAAIYVAAWAVGTPYTAAKAILMFAAPAALLALCELLGPERRSPGVRVLALAYVAGAAASTLLVLVNAPVGPSDYSPGLAELRQKFSGKPTLVVDPSSTFNRDHVRDFLAWEARGATPLCVERASGSLSAAPPEGIRFVVTRDSREAPFEDMLLRRRAGPYALWRLKGPVPGAAVGGPPGDPTECQLRPPASAIGPAGP
jgi:hypothetical protein